MLVITHGHTNNFDWFDFFFIPVVHQGPKTNTYWSVSKETKTKILKINVLPFWNNLSKFLFFFFFHFFKKYIFKPVFQSDLKILHISFIVEAKFLWKSAQNFSCGDISQIFIQSSYIKYIQMCLYCFICLFFVQIILNL